MPIDVRRFGAGHRRPDGLAGATGVEGQVITSDASGSIAELVFTRAARLPPHANARDAWFLVIEGGGWVGVGDERSRVSAGDAVSWPADVIHAAWTDGSPMRAIVVEQAGPILALPPVVDGRVVLPPGVAGAAPSRPASRGEGSLAQRPRTPGRGPLDDSSLEGEPD